MSATGVSYGPSVSSVGVTAEGIGTSSSDVELPVSGYGLIQPILAKYGADAHLWLPGIGYISGEDAANYIDSAGTQAGVVDSPVGLAKDAGGGAITATQGTTANKPILRRGAVNLLTYSQDFTNVAWTVTGANKISATSFSLDGTISSANYLNKIISTWANAGLTLTLSFTASCSTGGTIKVRLSNGVDQTNGDPIFTLTSTPTRFSSTFTFNSTVPSSAYLRFFTLDSAIVGKTIECTNIQLELGSTASEYIPTTTAAKSSNSGNYWWQFDGSNDSLALSSVPFQMADDHAVVVGCNATSFSVLRQVWFNGGLATSGRCASFFISTGALPAWIWRDDASAISTQLTLTAQAANTNFVSSAKKIGNTVTARLNAAGTQTGSVTGIGTTTVNSAFIGALQGSSNVHLGSIYPVIAIKGTVSDADLLILERWIGSLSGVSL